LVEEEREERKRREDLEKELRLREIALKERELEEQKGMTEMELKLISDRDEAHKSIVHRAKLFGDAMKNTICTNAH